MGMQTFTRAQWSQQHMIHDTSYVITLITHIKGENHIQLGQAAQYPACTAVLQMTLTHTPKQRAASTLNICIEASPASAGKPRGHIMRLAGDMAYSHDTQSPALPSFSLLSAPPCCHSATLCLALKTCVHAQSQGAVVQGTSIISTCQGNPSNRPSQHSRPDARLPAKSAQC
jgi:hypothetical protein